MLIYVPRGLERGNQSQRWVIREFHLEENDQGPQGAEKKWSKVQHLHIHCNEARLVEIQQSFPFNDMIIFLAAAYYLGWNRADLVGIV